jgi:uncharacterized RDD family membrane protein YckC
MNILRLCGAVILWLSLTSPIRSADQLDGSPATGECGACSIAAAIRAGLNVFPLSGAVTLHSNSKEFVSKPKKGDRVIIGREYLLNREETFNGDLTLIGSRGRIEGTVNGDVVLVGTTCRISGTVNGDLVNVASKTDLQEGALVHGDYVSFLSSGKHAEGTVTGDRTQIDLLSPGVLEGLHHWFAHTILLLRPMSPTSTVSWFLTLLVLALFLAIGFFLPRPVSETAQIIQERTPASILCGIVVVPAAAFLCFLLLVTVVGILAIPIVFATLLGFSALGNTALFELVGRKIAPKLGQPSPAQATGSSPSTPVTPSNQPPSFPRPHQVPLLWICLGAVVCWIFYSIPVIGFLIGSAVFLVSLGAATLYVLERTRPKRAPDAAPTTPLPVHPPAVPSPVDSPAAPAPVNSPAAESLSLPVVPTAPEKAPATGVPAVEFMPRLFGNFIDLGLVYLALSSAHATRYTLASWVLYRFAMYFWRSATLGEIILNLQVRKLDGGVLSNDFGACAVRALSSLVSLLPLGLGFIWIVFDPQKQTWHDKISGSYVVRTR